MHNAVVGLIYRVVSRGKAHAGAAMTRHRCSTLDTFTARIGGKNRRPFNLVTDRNGPALLGSYIDRLRGTGCKHNSAYQNGGR